MHRLSERSKYFILSRHFSFKDLKASLNMRVLEGDKVDIE
jgi:hypothetical protein